jgi:hypothetical protein
VTTIELDEALQAVSQLVPDLDDNDAPQEAPLLLDVTAAAEYAVRSCLSGGVDDAVAAGQCARDAVHEWVDRTLRPGMAAIDAQDIPAVQQGIDHHPLMVRELDQVRAIVSFLTARPVLDRTICLQIQALWPNGGKSNIDLE